LLYTLKGIITIYTSQGMKLENEDVGMQYLVSTPEQLAHTLRSARKVLGLSQDEAGKLVGLLPKTISALENHPGSASVESLFKLLSALGLELMVASKGSGISVAAAAKTGKAKREEW